MLTQLYSHQPSDHSFPLTSLAFDYLPILIWAERGSLSNGVSFRGRTRPKLCLSRLKSRETKAPGALRVDCADSRFLEDGNVLVSWSLRFF